MKSNFAEHLYNDIHNVILIDLSLKILFKCNKLNTLEQYQIYKALKTTLIRCY